MNKLQLITSIILSVITLAASAQTAREISEKSQDMVEFSAMEMLAKLKIYDAKGRERVRSVSTASKKFGDVNKTILKFTAPADVKGITMLIYDYDGKADDMWIYMPALRKTRRIVSSEKSKSFMGSEFTNADMSAPNMNDFEYKILDTETYNDLICWKIESKCKDEDIEDENGFSKKIAWIEKTSNLCYKIEFFDFDGELYKIQTIEEYKKQQNGKYFAYLMQAKNIKTERKSVMNIQQFQEGSALTERVFAPSAIAN